MSPNGPTFCDHKQCRITVEILDPISLVNNVFCYNYFPPLEPQLHNTACCLPAACLPVHPTQAAFFSILPIRRRARTELCCWAERTTKRDKVSFFLQQVKPRKSCTITCGGMLHQPMTPYISKEDACLPACLPARLMQSRPRSRNDVKIYISIDIGITTYVSSIWNTRTHFTTLATKLLMRAEWHSYSCN
jgi:hypothetical protein